MKLMTKALEAQFAKKGSQEHSGNPLVIAKFFNPTGPGHWWATEYNPDERMFFGYVQLFYDHCDEWGYFSLDELESLRVPPFGLPIERDRHFAPSAINQVKIPEQATA